MAKKPESRRQLNIHKAIMAEFKDHCWGFKVHGNEFTRKGIPDRIYCIHGFFFAFEVKMEWGEASQLQEYEIEQIKKAGGVAAVIESADEAIRLVRKTLAGAEERSRLRDKQDKERRRRRSFLTAKNW